jgi:hypothetical protein
MLKLLNNFDQLKSMPIGNSPYFKWSEALYLARLNAYVKPSVIEASNILSVVERLDAIRKHFGQPITVTSFLRPDTYNKLIGGAALSHHRTGSAVDFTVLGYSGDAVRNELKQHPMLTAGLGFETGIPHVHMQLMPQAPAGGIWFAPPINKAKLETK